jgi:L-alanine-DL-glutamate epimerase-like enolase superfamily enzyme
VLEGRAAAVAAEVEELADYLIGKDPHRIEDHWTVLYRAGRFARYPANQSGSDGGAMQQVNA